MGCQPRTVAYFVNWAIYGRKHRPQDLPIENLTHILYAFANVRSDSGEVYMTDGWADTDIHWENDSWNDNGTNLYGCLKQLNILKARNRHLNILLSVGGWTYSSNFAAPASTEQGRIRFADSCIDILKNLGFDGIDIDWEYPQDSTQAANYVALLKVVREKLNAYSATVEGNPHFELTVACPAGTENYQKLDIAGMDRYLDFWNLMAYDYAGSWDRIAGHQANLHHSPSNPTCTPFCTNKAVEYYHSHGTAKDKIVIGMPLYGRAFENTDGPGCPYNGIGEGSWERGVYDYKALPLPGAEERVDHEIGASYSYDPAKRMMVTYDNKEIAAKKAQWIKKNGLGGGMWWESSSDKAGDQSLIGTVVHIFGGPKALYKKVNCLKYPASKYDNLRNGSLA